MSQRMLNVVALVTMVTVARGQFHIWSFDVIKERLLPGHVIKTLPLFKADCMDTCQQTLSCFSVNIYKHQNGSDLCDLNRSTQTQTELVPMKGYDYAEPRERKFCSALECTVPKEALPNNVFMFNSTLFKLVSLNKTWDEARTYCQTMGGDLASFGSELEHQFALETLIHQLSKVKFGAPDTFLVNLSLEGGDSSVSLLNGAKYENTERGTALFFDGVDDFALVPRFVFYDKDITFGVWIKILAVNAVYVILSDDNGFKTRRSFEVDLINGKLLWKIHIDGGSNTIKMQSNGIVPANVWTHVGFTFEIATHKTTFYLNGKLLDISDSPTQGNLNLYAPASYMIGKTGHGGGFHFQGWMRDLIMISRVLNPFEMKALMDGERRAWIGLNDKASEGTLKFSNDAPLTYQNVDLMNSESKDCGAVVLVNTYPESWKMRDCQEKSYFICTNVTQNN